jgi:hypothetical protein
MDMLHEHSGLRLTTAVQSIDVLTSSKKKTLQFMDHRFMSHGLAVNVFQGLIFFGSAALVYCDLHLRRNTSKTLAEVRSNFIQVQS